MDWGKVIYVFFSLMSLTSIAGYLYDHNGVALFIAVSVNLISTILKIGVRNLLAAEIFAASLVADLHLLPAVYYQEVLNDIVTSYALAIGALVANAVSAVFVFIEISKSTDDEY